jgi:hypothetical protein
MKNNKELEQITNILEGLERIIDARERLLSEQPAAFMMRGFRMAPKIGTGAVKGLGGVIKRGVGDIVANAKMGIGMAGANLLVDKAREGWNKVTGKDQQQQPQ